MDKYGNLDHYDLAIVRELSQDSRISVQELGNRIGLSSTPCWNRVKALEAHQVIQKFTVQVDPALLGFIETVIVQVSLDSHSEKTVTAFQQGLQAIPEVMEAYLISGDNDYHIKIAAKSTSDFERLLREKFSKLPGVRYTKSSFVLRKLKDSALPI